MQKTTLGLLITHTTFWTGQFAHANRSVAHNWQAHASPLNSIWHGTATYTIPQIRSQVAPHSRVLAMLCTRHLPMGCIHNKGREERSGPVLGSTNGTKCLVIGGIRRDTCSSRTQQSHFFLPVNLKLLTMQSLDRKARTINRVAKQVMPYATRYQGTTTSTK